MTSNLHGLPRTSGQRVAVVIDHDEAARGLIGDVLRQAGFAPVPAADGAAGLEAVRRHAPSLVTLDLSLPGQDGISIAAELRRVCTAPILVISGNQDEIDVIEAMDAGANAFVPKPFRPRELRARVEALMRRQDLDRHAVVAAPAPAPAPVAPAPMAPPAPAPAPAVAPAVPAPVFQPAPVAPPVPTPVFEPAPVMEPAPVVEPAPVFQPAPPFQPAPVVEPAPVFQPAPVFEPAQVAEPVSTYSATDLPAPVRPSDGWEDFRGLAVNREHGLVEVHGEPVEVTRPQFDGLCAVLATGRNLRSRVDLAGVLFGRYGLEVTDADRAAVDAEMGGLLDALGESQVSPRWIEKIAGVGYRRTAL